MKTFSEYIKSLVKLESDGEKSPHGLIVAIKFNINAEKFKVLKAEDDYMLVEDITGSVSAIPYSSAIVKVTNITHSKAHEWKGAKLT